MAVSYSVIDSTVGVPAINVSGDTTQRISIGTIVIGRDPTYGQAEFKYVKFTGTVAAGDLVFHDAATPGAVVSPTSATKGSLGLAMAAQTSGSYGYVMIRGVHDAANVLTGSTIQAGPQFGGPNYGSALTAGRLTTAVTATYIVDGVAIRVSGASNVGTVELYWPFCSGR